MPGSNGVTSIISDNIRDQDSGLSNNYLDFDIFFNMPYAYIFENRLEGGIQHNSSEITDRFQLHNIQNFLFHQIKKEVSFKPKFVNVVLLAVDFSDGSLTTIWVVE